MLPFREYRRSGQPGGALRCVVRAIPVAVLRPTAGAAEALSYTLLGLRNNVDPEQRIDEEGESLLLTTIEFLFHIIKLNLFLYSATVMCIDDKLIRDFSIAFIVDMWNVTMKEE